MSKFDEALRAAQERAAGERDALTRLAERVTQDRDVLSAAIGDCREQLAALAARIDDAPAIAPAASDALARLDARLNESLARTEAALARLSALGVERAARDAEVTAALNALAARCDTLASDIRRQAADVGRALGLLDRTVPKSHVAELQEKLAVMSRHIDELRGVPRTADPGEAERPTGQAAFAALEQQLAAATRRLDERVDLLQRMIGRNPDYPRRESAGRQTTVAGTAVSDTNLIPARVARPLRWRAAAAAVLVGVAVVGAAMGFHSLSGVGGPLPTLFQDGKRQLRRWANDFGYGNSQMVIGLDDPVLQRRFADGLAALVRGESAVAERDFRDVSAARPSCAEAHYNLALALYQQQRRDAAVEELRQALRIRPDYEEAQEILQSLQAAGGH